MLVVGDLALAGAPHGTRVVHEPQHLTGAADGPGGFDRGGRVVGDLIRFGEPFMALDPVPEGVECVGVGFVGLLENSGGVDGGAAVDAGAPDPVADGLAPRLLGGGGGEHREDAGGERHGRGTGCGFEQGTSVGLGPQGLEGVLGGDPAVAVPGGTVHQRAFGRGAHCHDSDLPGQPVDLGEHFEALGRVLDDVEDVGAQHDVRRGTVPVRAVVGIPAACVVAEAGEVGDVLAVPAAVVQDCVVLAYEFVGEQQGEGARRAVTADGGRGPVDGDLVAAMAEPYGAATLLPPLMVMIGVWRRCGLAVRSVVGPGGLARESPAVPTGRAGLITRCARRGPATA
jgi:hypothetical protein